MATRPSVAARPRVDDANTTKTRKAAILRPDADIHQTDDHIVITADLPGVAPGDVDITLERQVLRIRGQVHPQVHDGYRRIHTEYGEGDYELVLSVSEHIDGDRIVARHTNGVLVLEMPKPASARARRIKVKAA